MMRGKNEITRPSLSWLRAGALLAVLAATSTASAQEDHRAWQHGISFLKLPGGAYEVVWSSAGNPPIEPDGNWTHDVYHARVDPSNASLDASSAPAIISESEAQEPASAAISQDGRIMITMEDGWNTANEVCQRYGVYDVNLEPVLAYPQMASDGGHSGHVAAVGNRFVVHYSDGWVDGGGVDDLGTGDDVIAAIYGSSGEHQATVNVAVGEATRDWWPIVAGAATRACLVWQRYVDGELYSDLMVAVLDPEAGALVVSPKKLETNVEYYHYSVKYIAAIDRFLIRGTFRNAGGGFGYLVAPDGAVTATNTSLESIVRESESIVRDDKGSAAVVQPMLPTGLSLLRVTPTSIEPKAGIADGYPWDYIGTDGAFVDTNRVFVASLATSGMVTKVFSDVALWGDFPGDGGEPGGTEGGVSDSGSAGAGGGGGSDSGAVSGGSDSSTPGGGAGAPSGASSDSRGALESSGCGCHLGARSSGGGSWILALLLLAGIGRVRSTLARPILSRTRGLP